MLLGFPWPGGLLLVTGAGSHGGGAVLGPVLRAWLAEMGLAVEVPWDDGKVVGGWGGCGCGNNGDVAIKIKQIEEIVG